MLVGVGCAVLGLVLGPFLAGLTLRIPAGDPRAGQALVGRRRGAAAAGRDRHRAGRGRLARSARRSGPRRSWPAYLWLAAVGVTLAVIDLDCLRLPDRLTLPSYPVGLVLLALPADWPALLRAVLAAIAAGGAALLLALGAPSGGFGLGDVKLLGLLGLFLGWLGWGVLMVGVFAGFVLGALVALGMLASRRAGLRDHLAFGPWLIAGALVAVVAGPSLVAAWTGVGP